MYGVYLLYKAPLLPSSPGRRKHWEEGLRNISEDRSHAWQSKKLLLLQTALLCSITPGFQDKHPPLLPAALLDFSNIVL